MRAYANEGWPLPTAHLLENGAGVGEVSSFFVAVNDDLFVYLWQERKEGGRLKAASHEGRREAVSVAESGRLTAPLPLQRPPHQRPRQLPQKLAYVPSQLSSAKVATETRITGNVFVLHVFAWVDGGSIDLPVHFRCYGFQLKVYGEEWSEI